MVCTMVYICDNDKWVLARCLKDMSRSSRDVHKMPKHKKENSKAYTVKERNIILYEKSL